MVESKGGLKMDTDHHILERVKKGDRQAFSELVIKHQKALLRTVLRLTRDVSAAEDVVQEAFMKAFEKLDSFEGRSSFKSWLFQIGLNTARNKLRGRRYDHVDYEKVNLSICSHQEDDVAIVDLRIIIQSEVGKLPEKQRTALSLRIFEDMSFAEIADVMSCPYDTAKANYRHALLKLKDRLGENLDLNLWKQFKHGKDAVGVEL
jgi:RNA polymerase sigma-70 factor (ECF subfamily)